MAVHSETATNSNIEEIEVKLLLEGVLMRYGYDFREYALSPLQRSIAAGMYRLFYSSLVRSGYLALGHRESLVFCPESSRYERVRDGVSLYQKAR